ncbi:MAG TPA: YihY family inner membrane protein [Gammaproteobacteria bacterium]|nr:YihY family inner membrane protein [Gammaproteobacteria bacterium]
MNPFSGLQQRLHALIAVLPQLPTRAARGLRTLGRFVWLVLDQYFRIRGPRIASALTFTTLLALVPLLTVAFSLFSRYPFFNEILHLAQDTLFDVLTPSAGLEVREQINSFVQETRRLTSVGLVVLVISAFSTLNTIDAAFNDIWHVNRTRNIFTTIIAYVTVLFLGPVLLGISISLTTYILSLPDIHALATSSLVARLLPWVPALATWLAFTLLYKWVPNTRVQWRHALTGGLLAMILFEFSKRGFALYLSWFPTYQVVYGAVAILPLLLVWMFISWTVVLIGAQTAHCLSFFHWSGRAGEETVGHLPVDIAARLLGLLYAAGRDGASAAQLVRQGIETDTETLTLLLEQLQEEGLVDTNEQGAWLWNHGNARLSVNELLHRFERAASMVRRHLPAVGE